MELNFSLNPTYIDEFGDSLSTKYENVDLPKFNDDDILVLDDADNSAIKKTVSIGSLFKKTKYTYKQAMIGKKIVTSIKREKDEKTDGYFYSYTTDGKTWTDITEDTTLNLEYTDGKKTTFTYEDKNVTVTATLQHAGAVPDDAEFVVTPVTADSKDYDYDAYMKSLNKNASKIAKEAGTDASTSTGDTYTDSNTLLYDIAFMADKTDEDGKVVNGEKAEYEPTEGMVKISFEFKKSQLSSDLGVTDADNITVVHLPLTDAVKENIDATADATSLKTSDIKTEVVDDQASVDGGNDTVEFSLDGLSVVAVSNPNSTVPQDESVGNYKNVLGEAIEYGIVADSYLQGTSHTETNFAVKNYSQSAYVGLELTNQNADIPFVIGNGNSIQLGMPNNGKYNLNFDFYVQSGFKTDRDSNADFHINKIYMTQEALNNKVDSIRQDAIQNSSKLAKCGSTSGVVITDKCVDTTEVSDNSTIIINVDSTSSDINNGLNDKLKITKLANQNIVFNVKDDNRILFKEIEVIVGNKSISTNAQTNSGNDSDINKTIDSLVLQHIVWNIVNSASEITIQDTAGLYLLPNANNVKVKNSAGWIVSGKAGAKVTSEGEWHFIYHGREYHSQGSTLFSATKVLNNATLSADEFLFGVYDSDGNLVGSAVKNAADGTISFPEISYTQDDVDSKTNKGEKYYYVKEIIPEEKNKQAGISYDDKEFKIKVVLQDDCKGNITATPYLVTLDDGKENLVEITSADQITFTNEYEASGSTSISATKTINGDKAHVNGQFTFELTGNGAPKTVTNDANGNISFGTISYDQGDVSAEAKHYTVKEVIPENKASGYTYDQSEYDVAVVVSDNGNGSLTAAKTIKKIKDKDGNEVSEAVESITFDNVYTTYDVNISKVDLAGKELAGATLKVTDSSDKEIAIWVSDGSVHTVSGLTAGTYTLTEISAPDGYKKAESITFVVNGDNTITVNGSEVDTVVMTDDYDYGSATLTKTDLETGEVLANATFELYRVNDDQSVTKIGGTYTTIANGTISVDNLRYGNYYFVETVAPIGYELDTSHHEFTISADSGVQSPVIVEVKDDPSKIVVSGVKYWDDSSNVDSIRPSSITIHLFRNGNQIATETVSPDENGNWEFSFGKQLKYVNGELAEYTVTEDSVDGYSASFSYTYSDTGRYVVLTNTHTPYTPDTPPETPDTPSTPETPESPQVLGASRGITEEAVPLTDTPSVLGATRSPATGDASDAAAWMFSILVSMAACGAWFFFRKRRKI